MQDGRDSNPALPDVLIPENERVIAYLRYIHAMPTSPVKGAFGEMGRAEVAARPVIASQGAYSYLCTHPDVVERIWTDLGTAIPVRCQYIVCSFPVLVHPRSGVVFVAAIGMNYFVRLPPKLLSHVRAGGSRRDKARSAAERLGNDWVPGKYRDQEIEWVQAAYEYFG